MTGCGEQCLLLVEGPAEGAISGAVLVASGPDWIEPPGLSMENGTVKLPVIINKIIIKIKSLCFDYSSCFPLEVCEEAEVYMQSFVLALNSARPLSSESLLNSADAKGWACSPFDFLHKVFSSDIHLFSAGH